MALLFATDFWWLSPSSGRSVFCMSGRPPPSFLHKTPHNVQFPGHLNFWIPLPLGPSALGEILAIDAIVSSRPAKLALFSPPSKSLLGRIGSEPYLLYPCPFVDPSPNQVLNATYPPCHALGLTYETRTSPLFPSPSVTPPPSHTDHKILLVF